MINKYSKKNKNIFVHSTFRPEPTKIKGKKKWRKTLVSRVYFCNFPPLIRLSALILFKKSKERDFCFYSLFETLQIILGKVFFLWLENRPSMTSWYVGRGAQGFCDGMRGSTKAIVIKSVTMEGGGQKLSTIARCHLWTTP